MPDGRHRVDAPAHETRMAPPSWTPGKPKAIRLLRRERSGTQRERSLGAATGRGDPSSCLCGEQTLNCRGRSRPRQLTLARARAHPLASSDAAPPSWPRFRLPHRMFSGINRPTRPRVLLFGILCLCPAITLSQSPGTGGRAEIFAGSDLERYLRYLQTVGLVGSYPWTIRDFGPTAVDSPVPLSVAHPWAEHYSVRPP